MSDTAPGSNLACALEPFLEELGFKEEEIKAIPGAGEELVMELFEENKCDDLDLAEAALAVDGCATCGVPTWRIGEPRPEATGPLSRRCAAGTIISKLQADYEKDKKHWPELAQWHENKG